MHGLIGASRSVALVAAGLVGGLAVVAAARGTQTDAEESTGWDELQPPIPAFEIGRWADRGEPRARLLLMNPGATWWVRSVRPSVVPPVSDLDPWVLDELAPGADLDVRHVELLLDPTALESFLSGCPNHPSTVVGLCYPERLAQEQGVIDDALAGYLGDPRERVALLAVERAVQLGDRGAALAGRVLDGEVEVEQRVQARVLATILRSWTLPRQEAVLELGQRLAEEDPVALAAALELGRHGVRSADDDLAQLEERLGDSSAALVVRFSRALAQRRSYEQMEEIGLRGL